MRGDAVCLDRPRVDQPQGGLRVGVTLGGAQDEVHLVAPVGARGRQPETRCSGPLRGGLLHRLGGQGVLGRAPQLLLEPAHPALDVRGGDLQGGDRHGVSDVHRNVGGAVDEDVP